MKKRRLLLMDLLSNLVAFIVLFNILSFALTLANGRLNLIYLLLAVPFAFMLFLRKKIKKMRLFLATHFFMLAIPFVVWHDMWAFGPLLGFVVAMILYSMRRKGEGEWNMQGSTAVWVIAFLVLLSMMYATYLPDIGGINALLNISSLISLASVVLYIYLDNMQFSLDLIGVSHQGNSAHTSSVSNVLFTVFLIMVVVFGALSLLFPSEAAALTIIHLLVGIIPLIFQFLALVFRGIAEEPVVVDNGVLDGMFMGMGEPLFEPDELAETGPFLAILIAAVRFLAIFGLVAAFTIFVVMLIYKLYKAFSREKRPGKQSLMPDDTINKLKFMLGDFKELLPRFKLSVKHPVRRAYIKKVNGHIKRGLEVRLHYTPEIIADKIRPKEDIDELTQRYEEVRYGKI